MVYVHLRKLVYISLVLIGRKYVHSLFVSKHIILLQGLLLWAIQESILLNIYYNIYN